MNEVWHWPNEHHWSALMHATHTAIVALPCTGGCHSVCTICQLQTTELRHWWHWSFKHKDGTVGKDSLFKGCGCNAIWSVCMLGHQYSRMHSSRLNAAVANAQVCKCIVYMYRQRLVYYNSESFLRKWLGIHYQKICRISMLYSWCVRHSGAS